MQTPAPGRIDGLDLARFLALVGMFGTHLWLIGADGSTPAVVGALEGKAAALFAVLAGVGIAITTRAALARGALGAARLSLLGRGAALVAIGLTLGLLPPFALVILAFYGVTFWLAIPLLKLRATVLFVVAGAWAIAWPIASHVVRAWIGSDELQIGSPSWFDLVRPGELLGELLLWGAYPALSWVTYVMVGIAIGKLVVEVRGDHRRLVARGMEIAGAGAVVAGLVLAADALLVQLVAVPAMLQEFGLAPNDPTLVRTALDDLQRSRYGVTDTSTPWLLLASGPHTATPVDLLITAGVAAAVIGACLTVGAVLAPRARKLLLPVLGAGGAPLTVYALHVVATSLSWRLGGSVFVDDDGLPWWLSSWPLWLVHLAIAMLLGLALRLSGRRGPLEWCVSELGRRTARLACVPHASHSPAVEQGGGAASREFTERRDEAPPA